MRDDAAAEATTTTRRELAVARSLDPARARAEKRVQRFLDAALELMTTSSGKEFTVQEVVERSGQSLRSFYQYFAGKYELLLALFEESGPLDGGAPRRGDRASPTCRSSACTASLVEYYRVCQPSPKAASRQEAPRPGHGRVRPAAAHRPPEGGRPRLRARWSRSSSGCSTRPSRRATSSPGSTTAGSPACVLQAIMFNVFASTISGSSVRDDTGQAAEELWGLVLGGIASR